MYLFTCKTGFNLHMGPLFILTQAQRSLLRLCVMGWAPLAPLKSQLVRFDPELLHCFQTQSWGDGKRERNEINNDSGADKSFSLCFWLSLWLCEDLSVPNTVTATGSGPSQVKYYRIVFYPILWKNTFAFRAVIYWVNQRYPKEITSACLLGSLVVLWPRIPPPLTDDPRAIFGFLVVTSK